MAQITLPDASSMVQMSHRQVIFPDASKFAAQMAQMNLPDTSYTAQMPQIIFFRRKLTAQVVEINLPETTSTAQMAHISFGGNLYGTDGSNHLARRNPHGTDGTKIIFPDASSRHRWHRSLCWTQAPRHRWHRSSFQTQAWGTNGTDHLARYNFHPEHRWQDDLCHLCHLLRHELYITGGTDHPP